jgi:hypothetical protein
VEQQGRKCEHLAINCKYSSRAEAVRELPTDEHGLATWRFMYPCPGCRKEYEATLSDIQNGRQQYQ